MVYGIAVSSLLWFCQSLLKALARSRIVVFIGQNTIWIYLYHVLFLLFVFRVCDIWRIQYIIVYGLSVSFVLIQYVLIQKTGPVKKFCKYLKG